MYKVTLHYDDMQVASAEHQFFTDAAERAIDEMPAMYIAVSRDVSLSVAKDGERLFDVPLSVHLAVTAPIELAA